MDVDTHLERTSSRAPVLPEPVPRRWLWLSLPIAGLAMGASLAGILVDAIYAEETSNWATQAVGQDVANVAVAYPALLVLAVLAARGSLRAALAWMGVLVYSAYTFAIYAFSVHFGPLFLVYVAVLGLSAYALIGGLTSLSPERVAASVAPRARVRSTAVLLVAVASAFGLLWLAEIVPSMLAGTTPETLVEVGLPTNPVYVLDLGLLLPAAMIAGVLLLRGRALGYVLAPVILVALIALGVGIVSVIGVAPLRGEAAMPAVGVVIGALTLLQLVVAVRFLRGVRGS